MRSKSNGFMLYGKLGVDFFSTSDFLYAKMKTRLRPIRARPNSYMISDKVKLVLELLTVLFTLVVLISNVIITGNERTCLLTLMWSLTN